jgi:hypothetical protein
LKNNKLLWTDQRNSYYLPNNHLIYSNYPSISMFRNWIFIIPYNLYRWRWNNWLWIIVCTCKATFNFSFYMDRYPKLPPPSHLFIKFIMLFLICVRKNVYNCISPFHHHSKWTIVDQDQNIHFHRKNKPWNKNLLQRAIIIRIFIIKLSIKFSMWTQAWLVYLMCFHKYFPVTKCVLE